MMRLTVQEYYDDLFDLNRHNDKLWVLVGVSDYRGVRSITVK